MKKLIQPLTALLYSLVAVLLGIGVYVMIAFSWFTNTELVEPDLSGFSVSAYFGGGKGTEDDPFLIKNQRHLYNLCWLQYLGYFNKVGTLNSNGQYVSGGSTLTQYSFSVENDLNMNGWYLPPIGTTLQPFIGILNGNGHSIYNLHTTNVFSEFGNRHPSSVNASNFANVEVIGFMGVVGKIDSMANNDKSIDTTDNAVANIKLKNNDIKTRTSTSLVGIAAGYINGYIEDIGIVNSSLDISGTKLANRDDISTYTVAGYATEDYIIKTSTTKAMVLNPTNTVKTSYVYSDEGDTTGWGGSINMYDMYTNVLLPKWDSSYSKRQFHQYYTTRTITIDKDGNQTSVYGPEPPTAYERPNLGGDFGYHEYSYETSYVGDKKIASYSFFHRENNSNYMYIAGNEPRTVSNAVTVTTKYEDAYLLSDGAGNYLTRNNSSLTNATDYSSTNSYWYFGDNGEIYTLNGTAKYYLNDDNGTLALGQISYTEWDTFGDTPMSQDGNYLVYDSGWKLKSTSESTVTGFTIGYNNHYLVYDEDADSIDDTTDVNQATVWQTDSNNNVYTTSNGTLRYLCTSGNYAQAIIISDTPNSRPFRRNNNRIRYTGNNNNYYLYYNNGWTAYNHTSSTNLSLTTSSTTEPFEMTYYYVPDKTSTENASYTTKTFYMPLQFGTDVNGDEGVDVKNTGYLVGGYYRGGTQPSDIRVSKYPMSSINNSYTPSGGFGTIYTINDSGMNVQITNSVITNSGWTKYNDSKDSLLEILKKDSSNVYGLHFMESTINIQHIITADWVSINGSDYIQNYQLPEDCIDFNLKEKGKVNFFAGTYFTDNNSFFSYNEIQRDANNNIVAIRAISEIYSDGNESHSYVYKYSDGKYSVPYSIEKVNGETVKKTLSGGTYTPYSTQNSLPSGYSSIFKTSWIGKQNSKYTTNRIYYFEVPTNEGEYALGSVANGKGAYLLYLDIGANAQQLNRTEITQKSTVTQYDYAYPKGIAIITDNTTIDDAINSASLNAANSSVLQIKTVNGQKTIAVSRISTTSINAVTDIDVTSTYIPRTQTLTKNSGAMTATAVKTTTSIYSQILYIDHNVTTGDIFETTIQKVNSEAPTYKIYKIGEGHTTTGFTPVEIDTTAQKPAWKLYRIVNNKNVLVDLTSASDTNATAIKTQLTNIAASTGTTILEYEYDALTSATNTYAIHINMTLDNNELYYYKFTGDDVTVTTDNVGGTIIYVNVSNTTYTFRLLNNDHTANLVVGTNVTLPLQ